MGNYTNRSGFGQYDIALHEHPMFRNINEPQVVGVVGSVEFGQPCSSLAPCQYSFAVRTIDDHPIRTGGVAPIRFPGIEQSFYVQMSLCMFKQIFGASFNIQVNGPHSVSL